MTRVNKKCYFDNNSVSCITDQAKVQAGRKCRHDVTSTCEDRYKNHKLTSFAMWTTDLRARSAYVWLFVYLLRVENSRVSFWWEKRWMKLAAWWEIKRGVYRSGFSNVWLEVFGRRATVRTMDLGLRLVKRTVVMVGVLLEKFRYPNGISLDWYRWTSMIIPPSYKSMHEKNVLQPMRMPTYQRVPWPSPEA